MLGRLAAGFPDLGQLRREELRAWVDGLAVARRPGQGGRGEPGAPLSAARRNKILVNIRAFLRWCVAQGYLAGCVADGLRAAAVEQRLRPQFVVAEARQLLAGPAVAVPLGYASADAVQAVRRWVALMLLLGLRADEARRLRWRDLDAAGRVAVVALDAGARVKRRRERLVPVPAALWPILGPAGPAGAAVAGVGGGSLPRCFRSYLRACVVPVDGRSPHSCRHTYAGLMTATGLPSGLLSAYLGHSSAATTLGYLSLAGRYAQGEAGQWRRGDLFPDPGK